MLADGGTKLPGDCPNPGCDQRNRATARYCARCGTYLGRDGSGVSRSPLDSPSRGALAIVGLLLFILVFAGLARSGEGAVLVLLPAVVGIAIWMKRDTRQRRRYM